MESKNKNHYDFFKLYDKFVKETQNGKRLQKNGKKVRESSIEPYLWLRKSLHDFSTVKNFPLHITNVKSIRKRELTVEKNYWKNFYQKFSDYLYNDLDCFDNYVGSNMKRLRAFFNYLNEEKELSIGSFHKRFYAHPEEIDIVTLSPDQVRFLLSDTAFEESLPEHLKHTKNMFVFGCMVALRCSDIFKISKKHIEYRDGVAYLNMNSQKTNTNTQIALPDQALEILNRYPWNRKVIFPEITNGRFNINIKTLIELAGWTHTKVKTRTKRGVPVEVFKNNKTKEMFRFCDMVSTHTMRRTAITNMLYLKMPENNIRKISGHAPNSKEFFKYVHISQKHMDEETSKMFKKLIDPNPVLE